ncbi:MAG: FkbM family methyltransferase [Pseudomonadota bacterium]
MLKWILPKKQRKAYKAWRRLAFAPVPESLEHLRNARGIVHIGAHKGQERYIYRKLGLDVLWIEGNPEIFPTLQQNLRRFPRQRPIQALLSETEGDEVVFHVSSNDGLSSSILDFSGHSTFYPDVSMAGQMRLRTKTFDSVISENGIDLTRYDAMTLDVQGAELIVLRGVGEHLRNFRWLTMETSDQETYAGGQTWGQLKAFLTPFGFREVSRNIFEEDKRMGTYFDVVLERQA